MVKPKRIICEVAGGIACVALGIVGGRLTGTNTKTITQQITTPGKVASTTSNAKESEKIAVVNLDAGIQKKQQKVYYANKIIEYPDDNFQTTSLEEAKKGIQTGQYGAYVVIPSTFSESVDSINGTPKVAVFDYQVSPVISEKSKINIVYEVCNFEKSINTNVSYVFIDAILNEVHGLQDNASAIMKNDSLDKETLMKVSADSLIQPVTFTEMKANNDKVKPVDLSKESTGLQNAVTSIDKTYSDSVKKGQADYKLIASGKGSVDTALSDLKTNLDGINPFITKGGSKINETGINTLKKQIEDSNMSVVTKQPELNTSIVTEIQSFADQNQLLLNDKRGLIQKDIREKVVPELQTELNDFLGATNDQLTNAESEAINVMDSDMDAYVEKLQKYVNSAVVSDEAKSVVKKLIEEKATEVLESVITSHTDYEKNKAEINAVKQYNSMIKGVNEKVATIQQDFNYLKSINPNRTPEPTVAPTEQPVASADPAASGEPTVSAAPTASPAPTKQEPSEEYTTALNKLAKDLEKLHTLSEKETPTSEPEPTVSVSVDKDQINTEDLKNAINLSEAVDSENQQIQKPKVNISIPTLEHTFNAQGIKYQVPSILLNKPENIDEKTLQSISDKYLISEETYTGIMQNSLITPVVERWKELHEQAKTKCSTFVTNQGEYQGKLNAYNPFSYVDSSKISTGISTISKNMTDIQTNMNNRNTEYIKYTSDVLLNANNNITTLRDNMTKASNQTKKNIENQVAALKTSRSTSSQSNISMLKGFSGKLTFTRVGGLPYREAYKFIVNPIKYNIVDR